MYIFLFFYFSLTISNYKTNIDILIYIYIYTHIYMQDLYDLGARKFVVLSTSPLGCLPFSRTIGGSIHRECADEYNQAVQIFNDKLSSQLASLSRELPHSTMVYADLYNPLIDIILESSKYGESKFVYSYCEMSESNN